MGIFKVQLKYLKSFLLLLIFILPYKPVFATMEDIQEVTKNLSVVTGEDVRIVVINSNDPYAYLHPMGYIVITTGLISFFNDRSEMAFIIGHELAHIAKGHYKTGSDILQFFQFFTSSLEKEIEADTYGLLYMKAAGYEPEASLKVLERMLKAGRGGHRMEERIDALTLLLHTLR